MTCSESEKTSYWIGTSDFDLGDGSVADSNSDGSTVENPPKEPKAVVTHSVSAHNIALYWEAGESWDEEVEVVVERRMGGAESFTEISRRPAAAHRFLDLALTPQTGYIYRLSACRAESCSSATETQETSTLPSILPEIEIDLPYGGEDNDDVFLMNIKNWLDADDLYAVVLAVDRTGTVLWSLQDLPGGYILENQPLDDGTVAVTTGESLAIFDLDGTETYRYTGDDVHHDIDRLSNGNLMYLIWYSLTRDDGVPLLADGIHILDPTTNEVVWEWLSEDYISTDDYCKSCITTTWKDYGYDWTHSNAATFDEAQSAIYLNVRNLNRLYKIKYPSGDVEWIMGDGGDFGKGLWSHSHAPLFFEEGRFLLFDNGLHRTDGTNWSRVVIVDYDETKKAAALSWEYRESPDFFTLGYGSAQFSENGIVVCDGANARVFEVTMEGEIVWQMTVAGSVYTPYKTNVLQRSFFENWGNPP